MSQTRGLIIVFRISHSGNDQRFVIPATDAIFSTDP